MNLILDQLSYDGKPTDSQDDDTLIADMSHPALLGLCPAHHSDRVYRITEYENVSPGLVFPFREPGAPYDFNILDIESIANLNHTDTIESIGKLVKIRQAQGSNVGVFNAPYQEWWPDDLDEKAISNRANKVGVWNKRLRNWGVDFIVGQAYNFAPSADPDWGLVHSRWIKSVNYFIRNARLAFPSRPIVMYIWQNLHNNGRPAWANQFMPPSMYRDQLRYLLGMKVIPAAWSDLRWKPDPNDASKLVIDRRWTADEMKPYVEILQEEARA